MIDEIQRDGDPTFYMDDDSVEETDGDDDDDDSDDDDDDDSDLSVNGDLSDAENYDKASDMLTPDAYKIKLLQKKAWTETLKRPRSYSMENGSW